jgi:Domain of unknown function (DUF4404)
MPDKPPTDKKPVPPIVGDIADLARRLRGAEHLEPEIRARAADLLDGLASDLQQAGPSAQKEQVAESAAQLVRAVQEEHEPGLIEAARERVEQAVAAAEAKAPVATDLVLRLIDVLAGLGI